MGVTVSSPGLVPSAGTGAVDSLPSLSAHVAFRHFLHHSFAPYFRGFSQSQS